MPKYKPGQFIKTPFGRMRVRKAEYASCRKCAIKHLEDCFLFTNMHNCSCCSLIGYYGYLEKI